MQPVGQYVNMSMLKRDPIVGPDLWGSRPDRKLKKKKEAVLYVINPGLRRLRRTKGSLIFDVIRQTNLSSSASAMVLTEVTSTCENILPNSTEKNLRCCFNWDGIRDSLVRSSMKCIHFDISVSFTSSLTASNATLTSNNNSA